MARGAERERRRNDELAGALAQLRGERDGQAAAAQAASADAETQRRRAQAAEEAVGGAAAAHSQSLQATGCVILSRERGGWNTCPEDLPGVRGSLTGPGCHACTVWELTASLDLNMGLCREALEEQKGVVDQLRQENERLRAGAAGLRAGASAQRDADRAIMEGLLTTVSLPRFQGLVPGRAQGQFNPLQSRQAAFPALVQGKCDKDWRPQRLSRNAACGSCRPGMRRAARRCGRSWPPRSAHTRSRAAPSLTCSSRHAPADGPHQAPHASRDHLDSPDGDARPGTRICRRGIGGGPRRRPCGAGRRTRMRRRRCGRAQRSRGSMRGRPWHG